MFSGVIYRGVCSLALMDVRKRYMVGIERLLKGHSLEEVCLEMMLVFLQIHVWA